MYEYKNAQISIEYLIIVGFVTFAVISILGVAMLYTGTIKDRIKVNYLDNYANKIISTSEYVFYSGEPSKATISCYLPDNVYDIYVAENSLVLRYHTSNGESIVAYQSNVPIEESATSPLAITPGIKKIVITAQADKAVLNQG